VNGYHRPAIIIRSSSAAGSASPATLRNAFSRLGQEIRTNSYLEEIKPEVEVLPEMSNSFSQQLNELSATEKQVLVERHLISREHAAKGMG